MKSTEPEPAEETLHRWSLMAVYIMGNALRRKLPPARLVPLLQATLNRGLVSVEDLSIAASQAWWPARFVMAEALMAILEARLSPPDEMLDWLADVFCDYCDLPGQPRKATTKPVPDKIRRAMNACIAADVDAEAAALEGAERLDGDPSPREQAIEIVAERYGLKPRQLKNRLADFREEGAPRSITSSSISSEVH